MPADSDTAGSAAQVLSQRTSNGDLRDSSNRALTSLFLSLSESPAKAGFVNLRTNIIKIN